MTHHTGVISSADGADGRVAKLCRSFTDAERTDLRRSIVQGANRFKSGVTGADRARVSIYQGLNKAAPVKSSFGEHTIVFRW